MTYCLALKTDSGIVFASDTRTNAGVDYITTYRKLHVFEPGEDRLFVILSAGNLATTQELLDRLRRDLDGDGSRESLRSVRYLFEAANYVGRLSREVQQRHAPALAESGVAGETTLIVGGQIRGEPHRMFLVYPQGNYIEASEDTPYLQIGETKYGKPMLDRVGSIHLGLEQAARLALVSLEATARSNITVGLPFDVAMYTADSFRLERAFRIDGESDYFRSLRDAWQQGIRRTFEELPRFEWEAPPTG